MNVIVDPKSVRPVEVTTGPISGSRKVYAAVGELSVPLARDRPGAERRRAAGSCL